MGVYDLYSGRKIQQVNFVFKGHRSIDKVAISGDGSRVAVSGGSWRTRGGSIVLVERVRIDGMESPNESSNEIARITNETGDVKDMAFSYDGNMLVICDKDGNLIFWDIQSDQVISHYCSSMFLCCDISRDGKYIVAGDNDGFIHLLKTETGRSSDLPQESEVLDFYQFTKMKPVSDSANPDQGDDSSSGDQPVSTLEYHGVFLEQAEASFLHELEQLLNRPIPAYSESDNANFGFGRGKSFE